jgi:spore coat protein U-like protein
MSAHRLIFRNLPSSRAGLLAILCVLIILPDTANAARRCNIRITSVNFGVYVPGSSMDVDANGEIRVRCRGNPAPGQPNSYILRMDGGQTGNPASRAMLSGVVNLFYNLFSDAARFVIWGDGSAGTSPVTQFISERRYNKTHTVYGRVFVGQDPDVGGYADAPMVTIEF